MFETCHAEGHRDLVAPARRPSAATFAARGTLPPLAHEVDAVVFRRVPLAPQRAGPTGDPVQVPPAEQKDAGVGARPAAARWLDAVVNRRNLAEVYFRSQPLAGDAAGLTTQFVNEQEIHSNTDVETAVPRPPVETRTEGGRTLCWFGRGLDVTGRTTMDILTDGPWRFTVDRAEAGRRYSFERSCTVGSGSTTVVVDARPSAKELESFVRRGEAEHDADTKVAFETNLGAYVSNVNGTSSGDSPATRVEASTPVECRARLAARENRDLLTQFVHDLNAATARRHAGGRHGVANTGLSFSKGCTTVTTRLEAGTL
jgi:hypothetical protein